MLLVDWCDSKVRSFYITFGNYLTETRVILRQSDTLSQSHRHFRRKWKNIYIYIYTWELVSYNLHRLISISSVYIHQSITQYVKLFAHSWRGEEISIYLSIYLCSYQSQSIHYLSLLSGLGLQSTPTASMQRVKTPPPKSVLDITLNNLMVRLQ